MLNKVIRAFVIMLARIDKNLPLSISIDMNKIDGKGYGAESISIEVKSALSLDLGNQKEGFVVFDIGSNIGNYAQELLLSKKVKEIYCFEPSKMSYAKLAERFSNETKVKLCNIALGKNECHTNLYSDSETSGLASLTKRRVEHFGIDFKNSETIHMKTLTQITQELGVIPDFIKIDVEGHELDVLNGGIEVLSKVKLIQFEFGGANIDTRTYFQDFWYFFQEQSFDLFRITPNGIKQINSYIEEDEYFKTTNILARNKVQSPN